MAFRVDFAVHLHRSGGSNKIGRRRKWRKKFEPLPIEEEARESVEAAEADEEEEEEEDSSSSCLTRSSPE